MYRNKLISSMIVNGADILYINNNAYVTAETVNKNSIISKMVAGAEAFKYDYLATYCVNDANKLEADKKLSGQYVVRFTHADKNVKDSAYSL